MFRCQWNGLIVVLGHHGIKVTVQKDSLRKSMHIHVELQKPKMRANEIQNERTLDSMSSTIAQQQKDLYRIFRTVYTQMKLNRPFSDFETEIELQKQNGLDVEQILHSNVYCASIEMHIGSEMRKQVMQNIVKGKRKFCNFNLRINHMYCKQTGNTHHLWTLYERRLKILNLLLYFFIWWNYHKLQQGL